MNTYFPRTIALSLLSLLFISLIGSGAWSQNPGAATDVISATGTAAGTLANDEEKGMTLYDLLKAGGWVMYIIGALSILALGLTIYYAISLTERKVVSNELVMQIRHYLQDRRYEDIARLCRRSKGIFGKVILAGITRGAIDPSGVSATMEAVGRREAESLMRKARYLSDIATIAPMLGLLGTVLGMIRAFNFIAFDISAVKPVALATAIAQALITTAAGLIVAIPCMGLFFYFRGKVQFLVGRVEEVAVEIAEAISSPDTTKRKTTIRKG